MFANRGTSIASAKAAELRLRERLGEIPGVVALRGKGCLLGIEFDNKCAAVHAGLLEAKIITGTSSDPNVLRLLPPLNVSPKEIDMLVDVLAERNIIAAS